MMITMKFKDDDKCEDIYLHFAYNKDEDIFIPYKFECYNSLDFQVEFMVHIRGDYDNMYNTWEERFPDDKIK